MDEIENREEGLYETIIYEIKNKEGELYESIMSVIKNNFQIEVFSFNIL